MNVKTFTLAGVAAPLFFASLASAEVTGLRIQLVDPSTQIGANGSWAANGYVEGALDTYRIYTTGAGADEILAVGDNFAGGNIFQLLSSTNAFFNAVGAFGNNGIQKPGDFTVIPGAAGYTAQWDTYLAIDGGNTVTTAPGLTTALGATSMGMGGLLTNANIDNTGWFNTPSGSTNTAFNPVSGFHEALILQLTVAEGVDITVNNAVITWGSAGGTPGLSQKLSATTAAVPAPGALALLGLAGLAARRRRR